MVKVYNIHTGEEVEQEPKIPGLECSICKSEFDIEEEGGTAGYFGMILVFFCPFCLSSTVDMVEKLRDDYEEEE